MEDVQTRNLILKDLCEYMSDTYKTIYFRNYRALQIVYEGTASSENPLRRLLVEHWRHRGTATSWVHDIEKAETLPKEFFVELAIALFNKGTVNREHSRQLLVDEDDIQDYLEKEDEDAVDQQMSTSVDINYVA
ncbi:hypothetical protein J1614_001867 [Plenodomus biglobosus]|nr:hypothetical protein J1614_001867 [Plenodomus biglobosus]